MASNPENLNNDSATGSRATVVRASGSTPSERYLQKLCERSFLKFWSHPCVFQDDGVSRCGQGKELCDLLVVFGDDILIFSDKHCEFPKHDDPHVAWTRWFKRAVLAGANQIFGAERRIKSFPNRLFLNPECTKAFPFPLPPPDRAHFHRIVVAHGASQACKNWFGSGSGSLMINSSLVGDEHLAKRQPPAYFTIGQINPTKGYVHVFDDATLDIVLKTLDTVADFVAYLSKKESLFARVHGVIAAGEEDLLAYFLSQLNSSGEHDFVLPTNMNCLLIDQGHWAEFIRHPQRLAQMEANRVSYLWDDLIEKFSHHIMNGTQQFTSCEGPNESELPLRFLAAENRTRRRMLAEGLREVVHRAGPTQRFVRVYQSTRPCEPYYVMLSMPSTHARSEEEYREVRRNLLQAYCLVCKHVHPAAKDIVGIAVSPTSESDCSEDLMYMDARQWTPEQAAEAASLQADLKLLQKVKPIHGKYSEYPQLIPAGRPFVSKGKFPRNAPCRCGSGQKFKKCCGR